MLQHEMENIQIYSIAPENTLLKMTEGKNKYKHKENKVNDKGK